MNQVKFERIVDLFLDKNKEALQMDYLLIRQGKDSYLHQFKEEAAYTQNVDTPHALLRRYAYGYGIWLAKEHNIIFGHGTDGQMLIIVPKDKLIIITLARQTNMKPIEQIINDVIIEIVEKNVCN